MNHFSHYLSLAGIFAAAIVGIYVFSYDPNLQMAVVLATAAGYVAWGVIHHWLHRDLYPSVIVEYLIVAILGVVLIFSLIFRA